MELKKLSDYSKLDSPVNVDGISSPGISMPGTEEQMILRMLVSPKYSSDWYIPDELMWLKQSILDLSNFDCVMHSVEHQWCYVTVRKGYVSTKTDDEWHFDGASFRVDLIPERNYVWCNHTPLQFKSGNMNIPPDFDPMRHNLFTFAAKQLENEPIESGETNQWQLLSPLCLHRRNPNAAGMRTFIRVSFLDMEIRDKNNTQNPMLETPAYGRDPKVTYRDNLKHYYEEVS